MKCLSLFSATARLLWQRFLLARVCRSEFDGELISVCAHFLVAYVCTFTYAGASLPDLLLRPPKRITRIATITADFAWMESLHSYPKYICFVGTSGQVGPFGKASANVWNLTKASHPAAKPAHGCDCVSRVTPFLPVHLLLGREEFKSATRHSFLWLFKHINCVFEQSYFFYTEMGGK